MIKEDRLNRVLAELSHTGYTTEIEKCEARLFIEELFKENNKYKEVIDKIKDSIDECWYMDSENVGEQVFLKKCELLDILKEVE